MTPPAAEPGTVYLLHFPRRYRHAGHSCEPTTDLPGRLAQHAAGRGARLLAVTRAAGIGWTLARTWPGPRARERQLTRQGGAARRCPTCRSHPSRTPPPAPATADRKAAMTASHPHPTPSPTADGGGTVWTLSAVDFYDAAANVLLAAGTDPALPMLHAVRLHVAGGRLHLAATDRYRLHRDSAPLHPDTPHPAAAGRWPGRYCSTAPTCTGS